MQLQILRWAVRPYITRILYTNTMLLVIPPQTRQPTHRTTFFVVIGNVFNLLFMYGYYKGYKNDGIYIETIDVFQDTKRF